MQNVARTSATVDSPWMALRVARRRMEAHRIVSFELVSTDGLPLPVFTAGAHVDVCAAEGIIRQYSICSAPHNRNRYVIAVLNDERSRGGSRALHERVFEGDILRVSQPRNLFAIDPARHSILVAAGIGITPILSMARQLHAAGSSFELHYVARSPLHAAFVDQLPEEGPFSRLHLYLQGRFGFDAGHVVRSPDATVHLYVCGPRGFRDDLLERARSFGWANGNLHTEKFQGDCRDFADDVSFEVEARRSGKVVVVRKEQTVIQALAGAGIAVPTACEQGVCGTCLTRVLKGQPLHLDSYLSDEERARGDCFLPCCSRSADSRLVIDL